MMAAETDERLFDPDDDGRYERDDDKIDQLLRQVHESTGKITTLFEDLGRHIDALEAEIKPRVKGPPP